MQDALYLGIDLGTSSVKAALADAHGAVRHVASAPLSVSRPQPLWSEQQPAEWLEAVDAAVLALPGEARARVEGVGLAGQMHGAVLLDAADRPLRPAILWNDGRSARECAALEARVPDLPSISGNRAMPGFTAPKLLWVARHEPGLFAATRTVLLPKDYVRLALTGEKASDLSDAAGTLWVDVGARAWSPTLLEACGLSLAHMPRLYEGPAVTGALRPEIAQRWGMGRAPVVAGAGDNAGAAIGMGLTEPGQGFLSLGTSGVLFLADDAFRPNPAGGVHAFCHAAPDRWCLMAVLLSAASAADKAAELLGFSDLVAALEAAEHAPEPDREVFLPYLSGERTPHNDPLATGVFFGLTHESTRGALMRAALEGVAFAFADGADALRAAGARLDAGLVLVGGGARSRYWGRLLAAALDTPLTLSEGAEAGPALGAARLAWMGASGSPHERLAPPPITGEIPVEPELADRLAHRRARYRQLYPALREAFQAPTRA